MVMSADTVVAVQAHPAGPSGRALSGPEAAEASSGNTRAPSHKGLPALPDPLESDDLSHA